MEYTNLGRTDIEVSRIVFGCWAIGGAWWGGTDDERAIASIRAALDCGVTFFDTAEGYGDGHSEKVLGQALQGQRDKTVIASKVSPDHLTSDLVKSSLEGSLKRLETDYLDVYFIHWPNPQIPIAETMEALLELQEEGKIRAIGASNFSVDQLSQALEYGRIEVIQPPYNLLWRFIEQDKLPFCIENDISVITYSSIAQGILAGKFDLDSEFPEGDERPSTPLFAEENLKRALEVVEGMKPIAGAHNKTLAQVAINWVLQQEGITAAIVGSRSPEQAEENAAAAGWRLNPDELETLREASDAFVDQLPEYDNYFGV